MSRAVVAATALSVLGLAQIVGDLANVDALRGLAAATSASPAPKVFSAVRGFETYSTRFFIEWTDARGVPRSVPVTSEVAARFRGPYNRRNVYGAVLAYGPVMPSALRTPVMAYALCAPGELLAELGVDAEGRTSELRLRYQPRPGAATSSDLDLTIEAPCR
jgi:hypothetical protein